MHEDEDVYLMFLSSQRAAGLDLHFVTDLVREVVQDAFVYISYLVMIHPLLLICVFAPGAAGTGSRCRHYGTSRRESAPSRRYRPCPRGDPRGATRLAG